MARGCTWNVPSQAGYPACYVPKDKGGYGETDRPQQFTDSETRYSLNRLSSKPRSDGMNSYVREDQDLATVRLNQFSLYGNDVDHLKVQVSVSGTDMIRLTVRDADKTRYEVPVPIQWQPSVVPSSVKAKMRFEMTKTDNGQAGFRVRRTDTQSIIFDTSYFAEGFIYDDQFIQIITTIPSRNVYGKTSTTFFRDLMHFLVRLR
jgi:hypothetical protein